MTDGRGGGAGRRAQGAESRGQEMRSER